MGPNLLLHSAFVNEDFARVQHSAGPWEYSHEQARHCHASHGLVKERGGQRTLQYRALSFMHGL